MIIQYNASLLLALIMTIIELTGKRRWGEAREERVLLRVGSVPPENSF